jgi:hypothetical protein
MTSSSRRVFIGYLVLAKAAEAGGDQTTPSRPPPTAIPMMIGNSGAPLEHLVHPAVCKTVGVIAEPASRLGTYLFRKWLGAGPGVPNPPPGPPRRLAAQGGKGELCTALTAICDISAVELSRLAPAGALAVMLLCGQKLADESVCQAKWRTYQGLSSCY